MMFGATFILTIFFASWSIFLRYLAAYLLHEHKHSKIKFQLFSKFDLLATIWWLFAAYQITNFLPAYFLFLSALWISIHTDFEKMLISRFVSLYLVPVGCILSTFNFLPISLTESFLAAVLGYGFFWIANKIFYLFKKHDGLGQGDLELIAMIGSFIGIIGCWFTILCASVLGTLCGALYLLIKRPSIKILPFGPFLAAGASIYILFQNIILRWLIT